MIYFTEPDEFTASTPWLGSDPTPEPELTQDELEAAFVEAFVTETADEGEAA